MGDIEGFLTYEEITDAMIDAYDTGIAGKSYDSIRKWINYVKRNNKFGRNRLMELPDKDIGKALKDTYLNRGRENTRRNRVY